MEGESWLHEQGKIIEKFHRGSCRINAAELVGHVTCVVSRGERGVGLGQIVTRKTSDSDSLQQNPNNSASGRIPLYIFIYKFLRIIWSPKNENKLAMNNVKLPEDILVQIRLDQSSSMLIIFLCDDTRILFKIHGHSERSA